MQRSQNANKLGVCFRCGQTDTRLVGAGPRRMKPFGFSVVYEGVAAGMKVGLTGVLRRISVTAHHSRYFAVLAFWLLCSVAATVALSTTSCGTSARTPAAVAVSAIAPNYRPGEPLTISFSAPVVGEDQVGRPLTDVPATLTPAAHVTAHFRDRQTLVLAPQESLAPSTTYRVELRGPLAQRVGEFDFSFVHHPLDVEGLWGVDVDQLSPRPELPIAFNQNVNPADVVKHCSLTTADGNAAPTLTTTAQAPGRRIRVVPQTPLAQGTVYELRCEGLIGLGGDTPMPESYTIALTTYPKFRIAKITPSGTDIPADEVAIEVVFSTPVQLDALRSVIRSSPAIPEIAQGWLDKSGTRYRINADLKTETEYTISVGKTLTDVFGQTLAKQSTHEFETGNANPRLTLETGIYAVELAAKGYPVWTRNLKKFQLQCAEVPSHGLVKLLTKGMDYDPWYNAQDDDIDWEEYGLKQRTRTIGLLHAKNKWQLSHVGLNKLCSDKRSAGGIYLAEFQSQDIVEDENRPWLYRPKRRVLANVTDLGVLMKIGPASGIVWVTRLSTGQPVANATVDIYDLKGRKIHRGSSDKSGIVRLPGSTQLLKKNPNGDRYSYRSQRVIAIVEHGGDTAVLDGNWANGIQTWNFGIREDRRGGKTRIRGFIQSDRGLYRPGEKVHFKGLVREIASGRAPRIPRGTDVSVSVENSRGKQLVEKELTLTPFGGFSFDFDLPSSADLGDYHVRAEFADQVFRERFSVEEYRKLSYEVDVKAGKRHATLGDPLKVNVNARYLFGAPVGNANVRWSVQRREHTLSFNKYRQYGFSDYAGNGYDSWWSRWNTNRSLSFVSDGEQAADTQGKLSFTIEDNNKKHHTPQDYIVSVSVTDDSKQTIAKQTVVTGHRSDFYLGMHAQEYVQAVGKAFSVNTVALTPTGTRVATKATLTLVEQRYQCSSQRHGYRSYQECKPAHRTLMTRKITIPRTGASTERIMPRKPGEFIIRMEATDSRGNRVVSSDYVWILGKGQAFWSGDESARMSLIASKPDYHPGDVAKLVPRANLRNATALITVERDGIIDARVTKLKSASEGIHIPIKHGYGPNVFASVAMVSGRSGQGDARRPRFKMGMTELKVSTKHSQLAIDVVPERQRYQPGERVDATIRVTSRGKPVQAELSVSVADEGLLQLIAYRTPNPMATFYQKWGLGTDAATNWNRISRLNDPRVIDPDEGGDSGDPEGAQVRSRFVSSAFWAPTLVTDERGEASVSFKAPDNLTAFRIMAVAADKGSRFGAGEQRITIAKQLLAKPVLPRFLIQGDKAHVGIMIHNNTDSDGTVAIEASATGVTLSQRSASTSLGKGQGKLVRFAVKPTGAKAATFEFRARMSGHTDAVRVSIPVHKPLIHTARTVREGHMRTTGLHEVPITWSRDVSEADSYLVVTADRTGLAALEPSLRYLIEYPYGCLEQTLSRFIPLTKVKDLASSLQLKDLKAGKLESYIRAGAERLPRFQKPNGHFGLWPNSRAMPHLTVYAVYGMLEAERAGVKVDNDMRTRALAAVRKWSARTSATLPPGGESATLAMAAYILTSTGKPDHGLNATLYSARRGLPLYGKAFLLRALAGSSDSTQARALRDELIGAIQTKANVAIARESVPGLGEYLNSNARSTAIVLSALVDTAPNADIVHKLALGLKKQRTSSGSWANTQDNLYALVALADYARLQSAGSTTVTVTHGTTQLVTKPLTGNVLSFKRPLSDLGRGTLTLSSTNGVHYNVRIVEARYDTNASAISNGLKVTRSYADAATGAPITNVNVGQVVKVTLTVSTKSRQRFVALVDRLPAGFEPINTKFATSKVTYRTAGNTYWRRWTHKELRDDRVQAFADILNPGDTTLEYLAKAITPGTFAALPATAEAMYTPTIAGRSTGQTIQVYK